MYPSILHPKGAMLTQVQDIMESSEIHNWATVLRVKHLDGGVRGQWCCFLHGTAYLFGEGCEAYRARVWDRVEEVCRLGQFFPVSRGNGSLDPGRGLLTSS